MIGITTDVCMYDQESAYSDVKSHQVFFCWKGETTTAPFTQREFLALVLQGALNFVTDEFAVSLVKS